MDSIQATLVVHYPVDDPPEYTTVMMEDDDNELPSYHEAVVTVASDDTQDCNDQHPKQCLNSEQRKKTLEKTTLS